MVYNTGGGEVGEPDLTGSAALEAVRSVGSCSSKSGMLPRAARLKSPPHLPAFSSICTGILIQMTNHHSSKDMNRHTYMNSLTSFFLAGS